MMDVSIIIVNYNTADILVDCIKSIYQHTKDVKFEVIVVDNNSSDNSRQLMYEYFEDIIYIQLPENVGFGRANNAGVENAKGKYIFFLNPDTILLNNATRILMEALNNNVEYGVVGGNLFDIDNKPMHSYLMLFPGVLIELDNIFFGFIHNFFWGKNYQFNHTNNHREVAYITGADLMMRKELFNRIGGFNPLFFMYYEETELCYRVHKVGFSVVNIPDSRIMHLEGASFDSKKSFNRYMLSALGRKTYYKLTHSKVITIIANILLLLSMIERLFIRFVLFDFAKCRLLLNELGFIFKLLF